MENQTYSANIFTSKSGKSGHENQIKLEKSENLRFGKNWKKSGTF